MRKLEESTEEFKHDTVDKSLSKAISAARLAKKMTQKDLATAIKYVSHIFPCAYNMFDIIFSSERPQVIQEYESGKAIPNPQIINKLDRALGTHLPRGRK